MKLLEISQFASLVIALFAIASLVITCWKIRHDDYNARNRPQATELVEVVEIEQNDDISPTNSELGPRRLILKYRSI